ncbi:MAG: CHAD domain-containing protein [Nigerium sp.]|nr:CHAD domain-containing protein [Nigerium sp.]
MTEPMTARDVLTRWMAKQIGVIQTREADVRIDATDAVHKTRVATRRLRSMLKTFAPLFRPRRAHALRTELTWLAGLLGDSRDAEVLLATFTSLLDDLGPDKVSDPVRTRLLEHLTRQHADAHADMVEGLDTKRARKLREALAFALDNPPLRADAGLPAAQVLLPLRARAVAEVALLGAHALIEPEELEDWHEVRKAAKAVRYASEAMTSALLSEGEIERWEAVTETFGTLQDTAVMIEVIDLLAEDASDDEQASWQALRDAELERQAKALSDGEDALDQALGAKL